MPTNDDTILIKRFRKGDESAFNELVKQYQKPVYQVARRLLGSHEDAEDVTQEVFLKAYRGLKTFREDASFFA
jgi:RNA polymerase sigma-70 factor (ECF subfamily)